MAAFKKIQKFPKVLVFIVRTEVLNILLNRLRLFIFRMVMDPDGNLAMNNSELMETE